MKNPKSLHDAEWQTGWKALPTALDHETRFRLVCELILPLSPGTIFDLGCGDGRQAAILKEAIPGVIVNGCDISPTALERASKRMDLCYDLDIDKSDLSETAESYDLVLCIAVLEHLYDFFHALQEMYRILKPGKHVLIQVPNLAFWRFRLEILMGRLPYILTDQRHLHSFNKSFLIKQLQHAGFTKFRTYGQRHRIKWLARLSPPLFSEDLFVLAQKQYTEKQEKANGCS